VVTHEWVWGKEHVQDIDLLEQSIVPLSTETSNHMKVCVPSIVRGLPEWERPCILSFPIEGNVISAAWPA
jgi:hypothetical protein